MKFEWNHQHLGIYIKSDVLIGINMSFEVTYRYQIILNHLNLSNICVDIWKSWILVSGQFTNFLMSVKDCTRNSQKILSEVKRSGVEVGQMWVNFLILFNKKAPSHEGWTVMGVLPSGDLCLDSVRSIVCLLKLEYTIYSHPTFIARYSKFGQKLDKQI